MGQTTTKDTGKSLLTAVDEDDSHMVIKRLRTYMQTQYLGEDCVTSSAYAKGVYGLEGDCVDNCKCDKNGKCVHLNSKTKCPSNPTQKAYEQIYGDDYVQQRGVDGYIPMHNAPHHYERVQPVYQPQLASTNPDSMQYGLMLLGLGLFLCLAICIVFVLLSAVCFVVGRFSNAKKSDKIEYEELAV
eukprot:260561_1